MADIPTITELPVAPARTDAPAVFVPRADAFMAALPGLGTELNAAIAQMNTNINQINIDVVTAAANAAIASAAANVTIWIANGTYTVGQIFFSPTNFLNYRCIVGHNTVATDPKDDPTNWKIHDASAATQIANASPATTSTHTFDYAQGQNQYIQAPNGGSLTLAFDNMPTGVLSAFLFQIEDGGDCAINYPAGTRFPNGIYPVLSESGIDWLSAWEDSAGNLTIALAMPSLAVPA